MFRRILACFLLGSLLVATAVARAEQPAKKNQDGSVIVVTQDGAKLRSLNGDVAAVLKKGTRFKVTQAGNDWIHGYVIVDGEKVSGAVKASALGPVKQAGDKRLERFREFDAWKFVAMVTSSAKWRIDGEGKLSGFDGDITLDFLFEKGPQIQLSERNGARHFDFDKPLPKTGLPGKVVLVTPKAKGTDARIPRFKVLTKEAKDLQFPFYAKQFYDYPGRYHLEVGFDAVQGNIGTRFVNYRLNCFSDGSEHHIFGKVKIFGVTFQNDSKEPLVFKISHGEYLYVKGKGTATTEKGEVVEFGG